MKRNSKEYKTFCKILEEELVLAQGCTEPIAVAYCASRARDLLKELPEKVIIEASGSIIKNVKSVIVPNTGRLKGLEAAATAGIIAGKTDKMLECIADADKNKATEMKKFLKTAKFNVKPLDKGASFDMVISLIKGSRFSKVRITNTHTNIVYEELDGKVLLKKDIKSDADQSTTDRSVLTIQNI